MNQSSVEPVEYPPVMLYLHTQLVIFHSLSTADEQVQHAIRIFALILDHLHDLKPYAKLLRTVHTQAQIFLTQSNLPRAVSLHRMCRAVIRHIQTLNPEWA